MYNKNNVLKKPKRLLIWNEGNTSEGSEAAVIKTKK
jgi:hypothetical protein